MMITHEKGRDDRAGTTFSAAPCWARMGCHLQCWSKNSPSYLLGWGGNLEASDTCELLQDFGQDTVPLSHPFTLWVFFFFFEQNGAPSMVKALEQDDMPIINLLISDLPSVLFVQAHLATGHLRYHYWLCRAIQICRDKMFGSLGLIGLVTPTSCLHSL